MIKLFVLVFSLLIGVTLSLIQEYNSCDNSFDCPSYCQRLGFSNGVCKVLTVDESTQMDGTKLGNRKLCLCDDQKEWFRYFFSPGHNCVRNGDEASCREYCRRIRIDEDYCRCRLSSCSFPKLFVKPARVDVPPVIAASVAGAAGTGVGVGVAAPTGPVGIASGGPAGVPIGQQ